MRELITGFLVGFIISLSCSLAGINSIGLQLGIALLASVPFSLFLFKGSK